MSAQILGFDMGGSADQPPRVGAEGRWWPYVVPDDASPEALGLLPAAELVLALQDTATVVQRVATAEDGSADDLVDEAFEILVDTRDRLAREIQRRLLEAEQLAAYRRFLDYRPGSSGRAAS